MLKTLGNVYLSRFVDHLILFNQLILFKIGNCRDHYWSSGNASRDMTNEKASHCVFFVAICIMLYINKCRGKQQETELNNSMEQLFVS